MLKKICRDDQLLENDEEVTLEEESSAGGYDTSDDGSVNSEDSILNEYEAAERIEHDEPDENNDVNDESSDVSDEESDEEAVQVTPHVPSFQQRAINNLPVTLKRGTTSNDFLLPILAASVRFNESYEQTLVHLRIVKSRLEHSTLPLTKKSLWASLERNDINITRHLYCYLCREYLGKGDTASIQCPCMSCGPGCDNTNVRYFLHVSLTAQIRDFLDIPNIVESLEYRFKRNKKTPRCFRGLV